MKVIGYGDNIVDKFLDRRTFYPGGNSVNYAVFAARLGVESEYLGVFGTDDLGDAMKAALDAEGVQRDHAQDVEGETGWCSVELRDGDRVFVDWNEGGVTTSSPLQVDAALLAHLAEADLVHSGVYGGTALSMPAVLGVDALVTYDFSAEPEFRTDEYLAPFAAGLDLALFSCSEQTEDEIVALLERVSAAGVGLVVATRGPDGSIAYDGSRVHRQASERVEDTLDTMGCGDAYIASLTTTLLAAGWAKGDHPAPTLVETAMAEASRYAAAQCRTEGAFGHGVGF
ncbi:PfkB family carbohydrate kinase [Curtobacterium sp. VKM Ac-1376]|uniref:PfkB family carbohydrate kinase n=1 Tax=Curtobacterium sp. VKM Ac-1376 TaxID=123312 RepID=UPI00188A4270|nr:PfkB family carbohydrate kinase [Curtobacterium sp. VKM Ac-1376]MBF4616024.1 sugar kinase [Curtobacterium sp. VKM Ac-1376]